MTIISNIHPNLAAWSSATYSVGNRRSNAGNAYQCTFPGASTGAPTGTGSNINNGGAARWNWLSAIDYTSLQNWWNAVPATLTDNIVSLSWNNGTVTGAPGTIFFDTVTNSVATAGFTVTVGCAAGESFRDKRGASALAFNATNGVSFTAPLTGTANQYWAIGTDNITIDGWQMLDGQAVNNDMIGTGANFTTLRNCIIDSVGASIMYSVSAATALYNCVLIDRTTKGVPVTWDLAATGGAVNCLLIAVNGNTGAGGFKANQSSAGAVTIRNTIIMGYTVPVFCQNLNGAVVIDHCCTDATDFNAPFGCTDNGNEQFSKSVANQFISATTDFRLKAGSDCLNNGATASVGIPTTDDIYRTFRPQGSAWDIGPFELPSAVPYHPAVQMAPLQAS